MMNDLPDKPRSFSAQSHTQSTKRESMKHIAGVAGGVTGNLAVIALLD
jgi:hypothetical protein